MESQTPSTEKTTGQDPLVRKARRASRRASAADWVQIVYPVVVTGLVVVVLLLLFRGQQDIRSTLSTGTKTLDTLNAAIKAGPAAQDAAIRQLLGCPARPAPCPNISQLIRNLGEEEITKLDALISRPSTTRVVTVAGRTRTIVVTRTITRTVVVCRTPSGKPC